MKMQMKKACKKFNTGGAVAKPKPFSDQSAPKLTSKEIQANKIAMEKQKRK